MSSACICNEQVASSDIFLCVHLASATSSWHPLVRSLLIARGTTACGMLFEHRGQQYIQLSGSCLCSLGFLLAVAYENLKILKEKFQKGQNKPKHRRFKSHARPRSAVKSISCSYDANHHLPSIHRTYATHPLHSNDVS